MCAEPRRDLDDAVKRIPTNLISITDGQIYLEPKLFHEGQKPAVDVSKSVSRVGGKTQIEAIRHLAGRLRLDYAQFLDLEVFARFGQVTDRHTTRALEHGKRVRAALAQRQSQPYSVATEVVLLLALHAGVLDEVALKHVQAFKSGLAESTRGNSLQRDTATGVRGLPRGCRSRDARSTAPVSRECAQARWAGLRPCFNSRTFRRA